MTTTANRAKPVNQELWNELMHYYTAEAWLLDQRRLAEWLELFTDDVLYYMPRRKNVSRRELEREVPPIGDLAFFEEDKQYLRMRVERLDSGMAWAEDPPSRTRHIFGNLVVTEQENGEVTALTAFIIFRSHLEIDQNIFAGSREDTLRKVDGEWKIAKRLILLDANVLPDKNLSVFF